MIKASEALKRPPLPKVRKGPLIRASELVKRRHAETTAALERAIEQREEAFAKLVRAHVKIWKLARQVQRYEKLV